MKSTAALLWVISIGTVSASAAAQSESDGVYEEANRQRRRHHDDRALRMLQAHYARTHEARAEAAMGLAEMALERWGDAESHLAEALVATPTPWLDTNRAALATALQRCRQRIGVGVLSVATSTVGAEVFINGMRMGTAGQPLRVSAGAVSFEVRAAGHLPVSRSVVVAAGANIQESVALEREPVATPPTERPPLVAVEPTPRPPPVDAPAAVQARVAPPLEATRPSRTLPALRVTALALGAVGLGLGIAGSVLREDAAQTYAGPGCVASPSDPECSYATLRDRYSAMNAMAIAGFVTGGVFTAAGVALWFVHPRAERSAAWSCGPGPGAIGAACVARF